MLLVDIVPDGLYIHTMKTGIIFILEDGSLLGKADYTRWNKTKWYQKLLGFFFKRYKRKFIDMKPFSAIIEPTKEA